MQWIMCDINTYKNISEIYILSYWDEQKLTIIYSKTGDKNNPPKCDTNVVITLVGKSACAKRHKMRPVLNGGGMQ